MSALALSIVGVGGYADVYLKAIRSLGPDVCQLRSVYVRNPERYERQISEIANEGIAVYHGFETMLEAERGKSALIVLPVGIDQHESLSILALESGYDVLCEKPLAATNASSDRMIATARNSGKRIAIGFQNIYSPSIQYIKNVRLSRSLGELIKAKTRFVYPRSTRYYTRNNWAGRLYVNGTPVFDSVFQNAGAHSLQNLLYVSGSSFQSSAVPAKIEAEQFRAYRIESADTQYLHITTEDGIELLAYGSHASHMRLESVAEFIFERGRLIWEGGNNGRVTLLTEDHSDTREAIDNGSIPIVEQMLKSVTEAVIQEKDFLCTPQNTKQHTGIIETVSTHFSIQTFAQDCIEDRSTDDLSDECILSVNGLNSIIIDAYQKEQSLMDSGANRLLDR
jgi:predicted dehydrogenase